MLPILIRFFIIIIIISTAFLRRTQGVTLNAGRDKQNRIHKSLQKKKKTS